MTNDDILDLAATMRQALSTNPEYVTLTKAEVAGLLQYISRMRALEARSKPLLVYEDHQGEEVSERERPRYARLLRDEVHKLSQLNRDMWAIHTKAGEIRESLAETITKANALLNKADKKAK